VFLVAPYVGRRFLSQARLEHARAVVFAQPWYTPRAIIVASDGSRIGRLEADGSTRPPPGGLDDECY